MVRCVIFSLQGRGYVSPLDVTVTVYSDSHTQCDSDWDLEDNPTAEKLKLKAPP